VSVLDRFLRRFGYAKSARPSLGAYAAGSHSRLYADWYPNLLSADQHIKAHRHLLVARSREMVRDNPQAARFVRLHQQNIIGPHGIRMQAVVQKSRPSPDAQGIGPNRPKPALRPSTNNALEDAWRDWTRLGNCTVDGKLSFTDLCRLLVATRFVDGEFLMLRHRGFDNEHFYALQVLDTLQLDGTLNRLPAAGRLEIRQGVEIDGYGRPVAYHIYPGHPAESNRGTPNRIPAENVIHGFRQIWPGQTRGVPDLACAMVLMKLQDGYREAEVVAAKSSASKGVLWKADPNFPGVFDAAATSNADKGGMTTPVEPGMQQLGLPGWEPVVVDPTHPNTAYPEFMQQLDREIAMGGGVSYIGLTGDLRAANYSSARVGALDERDNWREQQQWFVEHVCEPVFQDWRAMSRTSGRLVVPVTMDSRKLDQVRWQPRGWPWVDIAAEREADEAAVALGIKSRTMICGEQGIDYEEVLEQLAEEQALAELYGVDVEGTQAKKASLPPEFGGDKGSDKNGKGKPPFGKKPDDEDEPSNGNGRFGHVTLAELLP
jgi:lambda family phage portal protein